MKKLPIAVRFIIALAAIFFTFANTAMADDLTTVDPASRPPGGDNATNYSSDKNSSSSTKTLEQEEDDNQLTPDVATGEDDY